MLVSIKNCVIMIIAIMQFIHCGSVSLRALNTPFRPIIHIGRKRIENKAEGSAAPFPGISAKHRNGK